MKIGLVIPTRGDRPKFLKFAYHQIDKQIMKPDEIILVNDDPITDEKDITWRYKIGCKRAIDKGCDVILWWEDDDWYHPNYINWMVNKWEENNKPAIFGINETYYYHIKINKYHYMKHVGRASAFCTLVTPIVSDFRWPDDKYPFTDLKIWASVKNSLSISFDDTILAVGIKHGMGMTGGSGHNVKGFRWININGRPWFEKHIDRESILFYDSL
jgi:hypothetical protein